MTATHQPRAGMASSARGSYEYDALVLDAGTRQTLASVRSLGRAGLRVALAESYVQQLDFAEAEPLVERIGELADESGSVFGRALAWAARGMLENWRDNDAESEAAYLAARDLYAEMGNKLAEANMTMQIGRRAAFRAWSHYAPAASTARAASARPSGCVGWYR